MCVKANAAEKNFCVCWLLKSPSQERRVFQLDLQDLLISEIQWWAFENEQITISVVNGTIQEGLTYINPF